MRTFTIGTLALSALTVAFSPAAAQQALNTTTGLLTAPAKAGSPRPFYTTTGLLTADVEAGSLRSSAARAVVPEFAVSVLLTGPLLKRTKRAWIAGLHAPVLQLGNGNACEASGAGRECQNRRFVERATLYTGGAFDIRSAIFRVLVGPALYHVDGRGSRVGPAIHLDVAAPRLGGATPTIFFSRSFLGSEGGEGVGISSIGAGFRWVRKT